MITGYRAEYTIDYQGLTQHLTAPLPKLMTYLQETAIRHSETAGLTMEWFGEQLTGWVILGWNIEIISVPKWLDDITIVTAPAKFKGILAHRGFEMLDSSGNVILKAASQWVYTSRKNRRPIHPPEDMPAKYGNLIPLPLSPDFKIPSIDSCEHISSVSVTVTRRDIDTNLHVNNISYIDWAMDSIPEEVFNNMHITHSKISYKKECLLNDTVIVKTYRQDNTFTTIITDKWDNTLTEIYTVWNK